MLILVFALMSSSAVVLASRPQGFEFPKDGNGLLDYCGEVVVQLDSHGTPKSNEDAELKFGWCVGYLQATHEQITNWRTTVGIQRMAEGKDKPAPPYLWADTNFVNTCIPDEASIGQLARVLVKWLREHPERLHELKSFLVIEALRDNFPCAISKEVTKPEPAKH